MPASSAAKVLCRRGWDHHTALADSTDWIKVSSVANATSLKIRHKSGRRSPPNRMPESTLSSKCFPAIDETWSGRDFTSLGPTRLLKAICRPLDQQYRL